MKNKNIGYVNRRHACRTENIKKTIIQQKRNFLRKIPTNSIDTRLHAGSQQIEFVSDKTSKNYYDS